VEPPITVISEPALAIGGVTAFTLIVTVSGKLETPKLLLTTSLKTRSTPDADNGVVKIGDADVELLRVTAGPDVWVHL
jgi:hypothetical protein